MSLQPITRRQWSVSALQPGGHYITRSYREEPTEGELDNFLRETGAASCTVTPPTTNHQEA